MVKRLYILLCLLMVLHSSAQSQTPVIYDSADIEVRHLPFSQIKSYSEQKEFDYRENKAKAVSLWDRFWVWFWEQFYKMSQKESVQRSFEIFIWISSISLILFSIYRLTGMERRFFFRGGSGERPLSYREEQEDIHSINFDKSIQDAIDSEQYRLAIRLMYLKNIKILSDRNLIRFTPNKTNFDYTRELGATGYSRGFEDITLVYEYAWYGEFPIGKESFDRLRIIFSDYEKTIRS